MENLKERTERLKAELRSSCVSAAEAAGMLGVSERTLWRWIEAESIPFIKLADKNQPTLFIPLIAIRERMGEGNES